MVIQNVNDFMKILILFAEKRYFAYVFAFLGGIEYFL